MSEYELMIEDVRRNRDKINKEAFENSKNDLKKQSGIKNFINEIRNIELIF